MFMEFIRNIPNSILKRMGTAIVYILVANNTTVEKISYPFVKVINKFTKNETLKYIP